MRLYCFRLARLAERWRGCRFSHPPFGLVTTNGHRLTSPPRICRCLADSTNVLRARFVANLRIADNPSRTVPKLRQNQESALLDGADLNCPGLLIRGNSIGSPRSICQRTRGDVLFAMPHHHFRTPRPLTWFGRGLGAARRAGGEPADKRPLLNPMILKC